MSFKKTAILVVAAVLAISAGFVIYGIVSRRQAEVSAAAAPDFTVYNAQGEPVKLSDYRKKPVVLNFWASWCGPCQREMPDFETAWQKYGDEVVFLMVNLTDGYQETVETASSLIAEKGYTFPVCYDTDMDAATVYGVQSIPTTYFIDAKGAVVNRYTGSMDLKTLEEGIRQILP